MSGILQWQRSKRCDNNFCYKVKNGRYLTMSQEKSETPNVEPGVASSVASSMVAEDSAVEAVFQPIMDCYECSACGYVYEPRKGDERNKIESGTEFTALESTWRCPVCGVPKARFNNIGRAGAASGFKENLKYGFGVNTMTPGQKNLLIFGSLLLSVLFFLSLYSLE